MTKSNDSTITDAVARYIFKHAMEVADVRAPTPSDRRRHEGGYVFDEDSWDYPSFADVEDVDLLDGDNAPIGVDSRHTSNVDGQLLVFHGSIDGKEVKQVRSATYNPPSKAHPAEYSRQHIELWFTLSVPLSRPFTDEPLLTIEQA